MLTSGELSRDLLAGSSAEGLIAVPVLVHSPPIDLHAQKPFAIHWQWSDGD
jgi:hypothetical protein